MSVRFLQGLKTNRRDTWLLLILFAIIVATISAGQHLSASGAAIRRWPWHMLGIMLPLIPLAAWQRPAGLPSFAGASAPKRVWQTAWLAGMLFGLLDVLVIKVILHPGPYDSLPPFLQPFPYSLLLYTSGAIETELYYRLLPVTVVLGLHRRLAGHQSRTPWLIGLGIVTSLVEPLMQWPSGPGWFVAYALLSGFAMNALQYLMLVRYGFLPALCVRLGHYFIWHILLGIYVEFIELA